MHTLEEGILAVHSLPAGDSLVEDIPGLDTLAAHSLAVHGVADHSLAVHTVAYRQVSRNRPPSGNVACDQGQPVGNVTIPDLHADWNRSTGCFSLARVAFRKNQQLSTRSVRVVSPRTVAKKQRRMHDV